MEAEDLRVFLKYILVKDFNMETVETSKWGRERVVGGQYEGRTMELREDKGSKVGGLVSEGQHVGPQKQR